MLSKILTGLTTLASAVSALVTTWRNYTLKRQVEEEVFNAQNERLKNDLAKAEAIRLDYNNRPLSQSDILERL